MKFDYRTACMTLTGCISGVAALAAWLSLCFGEWVILALSGICLTLFLSLFVGIMNGGE